MNLFLTRLCHNRCPYCFAAGKLKYDIRDCSTDDFLSLENARVAADFFQRDREISFLGGEPTLHPDFQGITDLFLGRGYRVFLFSNGRFGDRTREYLAAQDRVFCVFNVNEPGFYPPGEWECINKNLSILRDKINSLAISIYRIGQNTDYLVELARRYSVKAVKIALAAPAGTGDNESVPFHDRHLLAEPLVRLVEALAAQNVITYGECEKLKPCMLEHPMKERLLAAGWKGAVHVNKQCRDGGNIDIAPDLTVWRCYSFPESLGRKLTDFGSPEEMRAYSRDRYAYLLFKEFYAEKCRDCEYAVRKECEGGCLTRIYNRLHHTSPVARG